jgi:hypothetical protein
MMSSSCRLIRHSHPGHAPGLVQVNTQRQPARLTLVFHMDQFDALGGTQGIGQTHHRINKGPLPLQRLDPVDLAMPSPALLFFSFSGTFGHILTEKTKTGEQPVSMFKPIMDTVTYQSIKPRPAENPPLFLQLDSGTDENGLKMERATRFELATPSLGSLYSTN